MFCRECGQKLEENQQECASCGTSKNPSTNPSSNDTPPAEETTVQPEAPKSKTTLIAIVVVIAVALFLIFFFFGKGGGQSSPESTAERALEALYIDLDMKEFAAFVVPDERPSEEELALFSGMLQQLEDYEVTISILSVEEEEETARVEFELEAKGEEEIMNDTMDLIKIDGKWYLAEFLF